MPNTYASPASYNSSLPTMAQGPLSGFLSGMRDQVGLDITHQQMRDDDLDYAIRQIQQQADQSNLGVTQADNANKILAAGVTQGLYNNGTMGTQAQATADSNIAEAQGKTMSAQDQVKAATAPLFVAMDNFIQAHPNHQLDPKNQNDINAYNQMKSQIDAHFPGGNSGLPSFPDSGDTQQIAQMAQNASAFISQKATAAKNTIPFIQQSALVGQKSASEEKQTGMKVTGGEQEATTHAEATKYAADKNSQARIQVGQMLSDRVKDDSAQMGILISQANKHGGPWTPSEAGQALYLQTKIRLNMKYAQLGELVNFQTPEQRQVLEAASKQDAIKDLSDNPGFKAAMQGMNSTTNPSAPSSAPSQIATGTGKTQDDPMIPPKGTNFDTFANSIPKGAYYKGPDGNTRLRQ